MRRFAAILFVLFLTSVLLLSAAACGSGDGVDGDGTATAEPAPPSDAEAIRDLELSEALPVQTLLRQLGGGELDEASVLFADVTRDGREEAVVPISSGGTLGNLAYVVLTLRSGNPVALLTVMRDRSSIGGVFMSMEDGKLVKTTGKYGPEDPRCCPSALIKTTYYWDGSNVQVEREEEVSQSGPKQ